jgi:hypothetical protein
LHFDCNREGSNPSTPANFERSFNTLIGDSTDVLEINPKGFHLYEKTPAEFFSEFIPYLEATTPEQWCEKVVRSKDSAANCLFGHLFNFAGPDENFANFLWDWFESRIATTYMVYPVNDGTNPRYPQATARERCIAYMKDLQSGTEETTEALMDRFDRERVAELVHA